MRRVHAILLILALLATPMALLARSECNPNACQCMCDLVNRTLLAHGHRGPALCGGQTDLSMPHHCTMNTKHQSPDFGLNALMAPTAPLPVAAIAASVAAVQAPLPQAASTPSGFLSAPFEPPRI